MFIGASAFRSINESREIDWPPFPRKGLTDNSAVPYTSLSEATGDFQLQTVSAGSASTVNKNFLSSK